MFILEGLRNYVTNGKKEMVNRMQLYSGPIRTKYICNFCVPTHL